MGYVYMAMMANSARTIIGFEISGQGNRGDAAQRGTREGAGTGGEEEGGEFVGL